MKNYSLSNFKEMSENIVRDAAEVLLNDPNNSFNRLLEIAREYRDAGLTPVFLCDNNMKNIIVTTKEKLLRKYH